LAFGNLIFGTFYIWLDEKLMSSTSGKLQNSKLEISLMKLFLKSRDLIDYIDIFGKPTLLKS
jgi:hypothetical protein